MQDDAVTFRESKIVQWWRYVCNANAARVYACLSRCFALLLILQPDLEVPNPGVRHPESEKTVVLARLCQFSTLMEMAGRRPLI